MEGVTLGGFVLFFAKNTCIPVRIERSFYQLYLNFQWDVETLGNAFERVAFLSLSRKDFVDVYHWLYSFASLSL